MKFQNSLYSRRRPGSYSFAIALALASPAFAAAQDPETAQLSQQGEVVWRETYPIEYSNQFNLSQRVADDSLMLKNQSRPPLDEKWLSLFPVLNPPLPNEAVILLKEQEADSTLNRTLNQLDSSPNLLRLSLQKHAAMTPQELLMVKSETSLSSDDWLRSLGRTPTRGEIAAYRKSRHKPTSRGVWLFRDTQEDSFARFASESQYQIIAAEGLWLMAQGRDGRRAAWRGVAATAVTGALTVAVKKTWRRRRPYPNDQKFGSFPSGHTSTVFAMATVMANASPRNKWLAYGSAAAVGWSRIKVRAHHPHDVLAGALLGYYVGKKFSPKTGETTPAPIANLNFRF